MARIRIFMNLIQHRKYGLEHLGLIDLFLSRSLAAEPIPYTYIEYLVSILP